ncbi:class IIb bacteriocin, lactobin A/cerein 7B family [Shewanella algae]|nr:class IIb bacteriocin, lactobin A/cerein 7B family [Shewanella algae]QTE80823.1 class IIb bacteriocin, lactobin A/cerein 7B family [Shewanella algae]
MQEIEQEDMVFISGGVIPLGVAVALHLAGNAGSIYAWYTFAQDHR